jgi:hypothetical protein
MGLPFEDTSANDVIAELTRITDQQRHAVKALAAEVAGRIAETDKVNEQIDAAAMQYQRVQRAEMQYFIDSAQRAHQSRASGNTTINVAGNVGVVMTGSHAVAHVNMGAHEKERLVEAVRAFEKAIAENQELAPDTRESAADITKDIVTAVEAAKPNPSKIGGLLSGLATTVQTVASLRGAWELVKDAAIAAGLIAP